MSLSVLFTSVTQCSRVIHRWSVCPGNMQEGSEEVDGGREELRAACDTFGGGWDAPGHAGDASKEKRI